MQSLEAHREIVVALPIESTGVDWKAGTAGVLTQVAKSTATELSEEAKAILKEAVSGDGSILHDVHLGGEKIEANRKSLIPDQDGEQSISVGDH